MFDKLNIFIKNNKEKEKSNNNFLLKLFSNKWELALITFVWYLTWVIYQIFKLTWILNNDFMVWNLVFFSFSSSINDFLIIFWYSFIIFILSFSIIFLPNLFFDKVVFIKNRSKIFQFLWFCIIFTGIWFLIYKETYNNSNYYIYIPYIISLVLTVIFFIKKLSLKTYFYSIFFSFYLYWFVIMLISWVKYYWCEKIRCNDANKTCFLLEYKNDKYWFTWQWDIYKLDDFKAFYTYDYIKNNIETWNENCE
jgi:hypothetical protein